MSLKYRIDFKLLFDVINANPNGDAINNRPNHFSDYTGYITQGALKHKIRIAAANNGSKILLIDLPDSKGFYAIRNKLDNQIVNNNDYKEYVRLICEEYLDVRAFGALIPKKKSDNEGESIGITGPVTINRAYSVDPIEIITESITKSYNMKNEEGIERSRYGVESYFMRYGLFVLNGSINASLSEVTGFNETDAEILKNALLHMFDDDVSNSRPAGSINVRKLYWWEHSKKYGIYKIDEVFDSLKIQKKEDIYSPLKFSDYNIFYNELEGLSVRIY